MLTRLLFFTCVFTPAAALAEVSENLTYSYYDVTARADKTLLSQLDAFSPIREEGQIYHGHTHWDIQWKFRWNTNESGVCRITSSSTSLVSVITIPRLNGANPRQQSIFDRYISSLEIHELGHHRLAVQMARKIDDDLIHLPGMNSCPELEAFADAQSQLSLERLKEQSRQYDLETGHGRTQGVWVDY